MTSGLFASYLRLMLEAVNLGKHLSGRWLFRGLSFTVSSGQTLVITGINGAGKSTLVKLLCGLVQPSEGSINRAFDPYIEAGYCALDLALYPTLSAQEHLLLAASLRDCEPRTDALLDQVGLQVDSAKQVKAFSSGMRARLKLALAIQSNPKCLFLDEPGASLDESGRAVVKQLVENQRENGVCIIATNDPQELELATHVLAL